MLTVTRETFDTLSTYWSDSRKDLQWDLPFLLPAWLRVWWQGFGAGNQAALSAVRDDGKIIGIAPLKIKETTASIVGSENVVDYVDFIVAPGREDDFFNALLEDLKQKGIRQLELALVRPDSLVLSRLADLASKRGCEVSCEREDVSYEMDLPPTWDGYLEQLNTKQRHEVRRKLRRLGEAGHIDYHWLKGDKNLDGLMDDFMRLFAFARDEKAHFMTGEMESFFRSLASALAGIGVLRLGALDMDGRRVAMIMCFDYNDCVFLYNSGCDPQYDPLSVGLLSKVLCIKESIQEGKKKFDFLKGGEIYKQRLGGREIPLHRCRIVIG